MSPLMSASDLSEDNENPNKSCRCQTLSALLLTHPRNPRQCRHCINTQETDPVDFSEHSRNSTGLISLRDQNCIIAQIWTKYCINA